MSVYLAGALLIIGLLSAVIVAIGVPLFIGLAVYDLVKSPKAERDVTADATAKIALHRGVARAFVLAGGGFWSVAAFAALYSYRQSGVPAALLAALYPLLACAVTLVVGWYYERFTAAMLAAASVAVVVWGVIFQFEMGVWVLMTLALLGPMATASVLFWMARREQDAFERETSVRPELAMVFAARSSIL
jgi:hypothetical protein